MGDAGQEGQEEEVRKTHWSVKRNHPYSSFRTNQTHLFLRLPPELRNEIWKYLDWKDCRALRTVCAVFKWDMDEVLGLNVVARAMGHDGLGIHPEWLQSVIVRSLKVLYIESIGSRRVPSYRDIRLRKPFMLHRLVLWFKKNEFSEPDNAEHIKRLLTSFNGLRTLDLTVWMETVSTEHFGTIFGEILTCLGTKPHLTELRVQVGGCQQVLAGRGFRIMPDPTYQPDFTVPMKLSKISLRIPILSRREILAWKALLDTQDQLTEAAVYVSLTDWDFFERALRLSASTLRHVAVALSVPESLVFQDSDLHLNITGHYITYNWDGVPDLVEHPTAFDWSILSGAQLESLRVKNPMTTQPCLAIRTQGFSTVRLALIKEIHLSGIYFSMEDLTRLLVEGSGLKIAHILNWTSVAEKGDRDYRLLLQVRISVILAMILQLREMTDLMLLDSSLYRFRVSLLSAVQERATAHKVACYNTVHWFTGSGGGLILAGLKNTKNPHEITH